MEFDIKPLHDRVIIRRIEEHDQRSQGGIIIPDVAKEKPIEGVVVEVGNGTRDETGRLIPLDVSVGDNVLFGKYAGTDIKYNGTDYLIVRENEILAIVRNRITK